MSTSVCRRPVTDRGIRARILAHGDANEERLETEQLTRSRPPSVSLRKRTAKARPVVAGYQADTRAAAGPRRTRGLRSPKGAHLAAVAPADQSAAEAPVSATGRPDAIGATESSPKQSFAAVPRECESDHPWRGARHSDRRASRRRCKLAAGLFIHVEIDDRAVCGDSFSM